MTGIVVLQANQPPNRPYRGGSRITSFRAGIAARISSGEQEFLPEDWIASTTALFGHDRLGQSELPDGRLLVEAIHADPLGWLGADHVASFGENPQLLTKLLDAGERLFVHAHPSDAFAHGHHFANGKAEAWYILDGGEVHLGLREPVERADLLDLAKNQHTEELLSLLNRVAVQPGDVVAVPPGVLHAIGAGVFIVELQQPADLSILLEWKGFPIDGATEGNLGLGLDVALGAIETRARPDLGELVMPSRFGESVLPPVMDDYLRLERRQVVDQLEIERGFAVLITLDGEVALGGTPLPSGTTAVIPYAINALELSGRGEILLARPPRP